MPTIRRALCLVALALAACPAVPSYDRDTATWPVDTDIPWDAPDTPAIVPTGFDDCETALDCATFPNSASICDHLQCALQCIPSFANCDREHENGCEQSLSTPAHCGGCSLPCAPFEAFGTCAGGQCGVAACKLGFGDCDAEPANGCETLLVTPTDCGGCGVPCALPNAEPTCDAADCAVATCHPGFGDCDDSSENGCETQVDTRLRCGACDIPCAPGQGCATTFPPPEIEGDEPTPESRCSPTPALIIPLPTPANGVAIAPDGAVYTAVTATEPLTWGDDILEIAGPADALLLRHDPSGAPDWAKTIGGLNTDTASAVAAGANGHITFAGTYQSGAKLGGGLLPTIGGADVFVVRYDAHGTQVWGFGTGGPGHDTLAALATDSGGAAVIAGTAIPPASFGGDILTGQPGLPIGYVARYAATGSADWSASLVSQTEVSVIDVATAAESTVHVLASSATPIQVADADVTTAGPAVVSWTVDGALLETQSVPLETVTALAVTPDGVLIVAGSDAAGDGQVVALGQDGFAALDLAGVTDLTTPADGQLYITGSTSGAFDVGLGPVIVDGAFATRYDTTTGEATWFVALDEPSPEPRIAVHGTRVLVAGESITPLDE